MMISRLPSSLNRFLRLKNAETAAKVPTMTTKATMTTTTWSSLCWIQNPKLDNLSYKPGTRRTTHLASTTSTSQLSLLRQRHQQPFSTTSDSSSPSSVPFFPHYEIRQSRWNDNDGFGHINNSVYYQYMDDAINMQLIDRGIGAAYPRFIAENGIQYFRPISFPNNIKVGLRVVKLGTSAVTYDVGFFAVESNKIGTDDGKHGGTQEKQQKNLAARGKFVHVYIDIKTGRPVTIPDEARRVLQLLQVEESRDEQEQ